MAGLSIKPLVGAGGALGGGSSSLLSNLPSTAEKNKQWQRELLMERIRSHSSQHKTFPELSKGMRMGMLEKRYPLDAVEKSNLQKCLDNMQHCIKVTSRQGLVERLESLSRQLSLKFSDDSKALFISTDMFYLEILLDSNGCLTDVKVHHESKVEQQSCSELVDCLNRGDFADFTAQLEGFSSIYQLNAESKVKIKAYDAMLAMETDLYNVFQMQNFSKDATQVLQDSAVGIVMQRRGGHPMRLVYFVSPYDLISLETKTLEPITLDTFNNKQIGFSVTVNLEASSANKLQIAPTVTLSKDPQTGMEMPVFAPLTQMNSMLLPATFVLRLNTPLPVCYNTLRSMGLCLAASNDSSSSSSNPPLPTSSSTLEAQNKPPIITNIMQLVVQTASEQQIKTSQKGLFVCLPDQTHCYFFTENKLMKSTLVQSVPFTEPSQVRKILEFLKRMALFYSLLASCVRPQSKTGLDIDSTTVLEVNAISFQQISVALQHPYEESMATVEFDLRSGVPQCSIYSISNNYDLLSIKLTSIAQKCLSIPVTIRALMKFWDQERMKMFQRSLGATSNSVLGGGGGGGGSNNTGGGGSAGSGAGGMGGNSHSAYGNFNLSGSNNDAGIGMSRLVGGGAAGGGLAGLGGSIKMEPNMAGVQQRSPQVSATNVAGFLKFKAGEIKQEDFHESPKSQTIPTVADAMQPSSVAATNLMHSNLDMINSLGPQQQQQQPQQHHLHHELQIADNEIADKYKNIWKDKTSSLKNTVSITPIHADSSTTPTATSALSTANSVSSSSSSSSTTSAMDVKRTGGIEIIPLNNPSINVPTAVGMAVNSTGSATITITPINSNLSSAAASSNSLSASTSSSKEKIKSSANAIGLVASAGSSSSSSSSSGKRSLELCDGQKEKKRKKKRDDSPMGPPEKIFSRQNSPAGSSEAAATAVARKFSSPSSSPKGSSGGLLASSQTGSSLSARPSPKHSPVYSSPKHNTASNSPKSPFGTHSPKHGSSGKPSMSTLKSATAASPKGDKATSCAVSQSAGSVLSTSALVRSLSSSQVGSSTTSASLASSTSSSSSSLSTLTANTVAAAAAAAAAAAMAALKNKDKTSPSSSMSASSAAMSSAAAAAAAAVKSSMGVAALQQLKAVTNLNHMTSSAAASTGYVTSNTTTQAANSSSMDLSSAMRKGGITAAVSLMTSTPVTPTISKLEMSQMSVAQQHSASASAPQASNSKQQPPMPMSRLGISELKISSYNSRNINKSGGSSGSSTGKDAILNSDSSNSEYMVKPSQEGLKLTINKTTTSKTSSSSSSSSLTSGYSSSSSSSTYSKSSASKLLTQRMGSPFQFSSSKKPHTGLKPGVTSGPASKKSSSSSSSGSSRSSSFSSSSSSSKHVFQKSNSSSSLSTKLQSSTNSSSSSSSSGLGLPKSHSTNSFGDYHPRKFAKKSLSASSSPALSGPYSNSGFSSSSSSQPATRLDHQADMMKILQYASPTMAASMEGFMKGLNSRFQIPKLSQRNNAAAAASVAASTTSMTSIENSTASHSTSASTTINSMAFRNNDSKLTTSSATTTSSSASLTQQQHPPATNDHLLKSPSSLTKSKDFPLAITNSSKSSSSATAANVVNDSLLRPSEK